MATKVKSYRINITDEPLEWDALVIWEDWWIVTNHLWTVSSLDVGTTEWTIPVLLEDWKLPDSTSPSSTMKKCIYDPNNKEADVYDYCNLDNAPEIPVVNDPVVTFTQGWITVWSISLNQAWPTTIWLLSGWVTSWDWITIAGNVVSVNYDNNSLWIDTCNKLNVKDYSTIVSWAAAWATAVQANDLATVAMTGNYCDLINKPEIPSAQIQSDWEQTNINLADYIKNKPTIGNATITLQKNGSNVDTFELNQTADKCINLVLSKSDVGLWNVDNTSDADKPVSDATLAALACKQDNITDLNTIRSNACAGKTASETIANYWNIVTHNTNEFATATQGWKADTAVQPWDLCTVATTGAYSDLTGTPALCSVATSGSYTDLSNTPALCNVATSWKYCDLTWTPLLCNIATTAQYSDLLWTPNLCTVATSGKYCDLSWTPTIPTVINTLTSSCTTEALSAKQGCVLNASITDINWKIPSAATTSNQLADKAFVNSSINAVAAYYITKDTQWDQFATKAELDAATVYYSGWEVRTPTRNDYTIVASDEIHDNATTRYSYNNGWEYQYTINETPLTQAQLNALNSGITSGKVSSYDSAVNVVNNLSTVATSGKYCDLSGAPILCTVATTGKYCDLSGLPTIPTNNNQLTNGCGYTTCTGTLVASDLTPYAKSCTLCTVANSGKYCDLTGLPTIPTNNNQLTNGCWYTTCTGTLVAWDLAPYAKSADLATVATSGKYCDLSWAPSLATVATTGCYNDLTGKPTIPTKVSQLTNDCNYINKSVNNLDNYTPTSSLATVATSGAYCDLSWKPTLACVACSGSYEDLTCKPNLWVYQTTANMVCTLSNADNSHYPSAKAVADALSCAWAWDMLSSVYDPNGKCADAFDYTNFINTPLLCAVATSGKYCDLTGLPTIPAALSAGNGISITSNCINVNYDWSTIKKNDWNCLYADLTWYALSCDVITRKSTTWSQTVCTTASWCTTAFWVKSNATSSYISFNNCSGWLASIWATSDKKPTWYNGTWHTLAYAEDIPTDNCQLANWCGYTTCTWTVVASDLTPYAKTCDLATVATSWCYCDLIWAPDIPSVNTQTFSLNSTSDITNATAALTYINWWGNALIKYNWAIYTLYSKSNSSVVFKSSLETVWCASYSIIQQNNLTFTISNNAVTTITVWNTSLGKYLETDRNYSTPWTPTYNGSPTTKKYVDDCLACKVNSSSLCAIATSWKYCDLTGTPTIPTDNCQLGNWCWYITSSALDWYVTTDSLCTVATSWKYCDLTGKPTIPTDNCQLANSCGYTTCTGTLTDSSLKTVNWCSLVWSWDICIQSGTWWQITGTLSNQTDLNTALNWKLDKVTDTNTYWRVYWISTTWEQVTVCISPGLVNNTLVRRSWNQIIVPDAPTATCHATSKCYVDSCLWTKANSSSLCTVATSGKYCDLTGLPTIPTNNNQLTNWCWYTTCTWTLTQSAISDTAFSSSWNWDTTHAPSKNAVYDIIWDIETLLAAL